LEEKLIELNKKLYKKVSLIYKNDEYVLKYI